MGRRQPYCILACVCACARVCVLLNVEKSFHDTIYGFCVNSRSMLLQVNSWHFLANGKCTPTQFHSNIIGEKIMDETVDQC